jgi:N-acetyl-anhydromuramyl-L-alanine amidase AmpD
MNKKEFDLSGITRWHKKGYTGKSIRIANLESTDPQLPFFDGKVKDPFGIATGFGRNYHGHQTADIMHQVAPDAEIYILSSAGSYGAGKASGRFIEESIPYMENKGIHLVNASKGGTNNRILNERIKQAQQHGVTFVTSAGNEADSGPSGYARSGVWIAVGAVHLSEKGEILHAGYSSIGEEVDFTQFSGLYVHDARKGYEDRTFLVQGTSFSSPMLCGMLALVQQYFLEKVGRTLKQNELYRFMQDNSIDLGTEGHDHKTGHGLFVLPEPESIDVWKYVGKEDKPEVNNPEYIIIHHSATTQGDAETFRRAHRAKGWRDIGYHYVIGNGTYSGDGEVETGRPENESGAHCSADGMNFKSIGICLVGNFDIDKPTPAQMEALEKLCRDIMERHKIPASRVLGHGEVKGAATNCPGKNFDMAAFRKRLEGKPVEKKDYEGHWAETYIKKAINYGYMTGYPDGSFKPDNPITRAEFARVLSFIIDRLERR